jgi:AraC-like DNA-binding protein
MVENWSKKVVISGIGGRVRCEPGWSLGRGWSDQLDDFDLWLVWSGRGTMRLHDRELALRPGSCIWMRPGARYEAQQDPHDRLGVCFIHFKVEAESDFAPPFEAVEVRSLEFAAGLLSEAVRWRGEDPALAARLLGDLLAVLARDHGQAVGPGAAAPTAVGRRRERQIRALVARILEQPGEKWPVAQMARGVGLAPDHFSRVFQAVVGERPQAFVLRNRVARAQQLLLQTDLQVGEIAQLLGFRDSFYFSRQFRAFCGVAPSRFRRTIGDFSAG